VVYCRDTSVRVSKLLGIIYSVNLCEVSSAFAGDSYVRFVSKDVLFISVSYGLFIRSFPLLNAGPLDKI